MPDFDQRSHLARALTQLVIQARVLEGNRQMIAEDVDQPLMVPIEVIRLGAFERQDSNDTLLAHQDQRDSDLGTRFLPTFNGHPEVARIREEIIDDNCVTGADGCRGDAAIQRYEFVARNFLRRIADRLLPDQAPRDSSTSRRLKNL